MAAKGKMFKNTKTSVNTKVKDREEGKRGESRRRRVRRVVVDKLWRPTVAGMKLRV